MLISVVFVLGGPGSGKGTNCTKIVNDFKYTHLSAGDLLRKERKSGSQLAEMINTFMKEGKIVPAEVTVKLLKDAMEESGCEYFLVDGFPRDIDNLEAWDNLMSDIAETQFLLFLECPNEVMVQRLLERGKTSGRNDDNIETIQKRIVVYENMTMPIVEHFRKLDKMKQVDANRSEALVYEDVKIHFEKLRPPIIPPVETNVIPTPPPSNPTPAVVTAPVEVIAPVVAATTLPTVTASA